MFLLMFASSLTLNAILIRYVAPALALLVSLIYARRPFKLPAELALYFAMFVWTHAGLIYAPDLDAFANYYALISRTFILSFLIVVVVRITNRPDILARSFILVNLASLVAFFATGNVTTLVPGVVVAQQMSTQSILSTLGSGGLRIWLLYSNPNGFAWINLLGIFALIFTLPRTRNRFFKLLHIVLILVLFLMILLTASRNALLALVVSVLTWLWLMQRQRFKSKIVFVASFLLALLVFSQGLTYVLSHTYVGQRMQEFYQAGTLLEENKRVLLYYDAWHTFLQYPLTGIGLGNFAIVSKYHAYAHSDFMELLATTGVVGTACYYGIYVLLWRRVGRLKLLLADDRQTSHMLNAVYVIILGLLSIGFGKPNFLDVFAQMILFVLVGWTFHMEQQIKVTSRVAAAGP